MINASRTFAVLAPLAAMFATMPVHAQDDHAAGIRPAGAAGGQDCEREKRDCEEPVDSHRGDIVA